MINIGCHLSSSKGYLSMGETAKSIGANTFAYFTRNPRGGACKKVDMEDLRAFLKFSSEENFARIVAHAPYTLNLCSSAEHIRNFSERVFKEDIERTELIPGSFYNFHPGSHTGQGIDVGIEQISKALNEIIFPGQKTTILLETMSGKGSEVGGKFEEIKKIINNIEIKDKVGVCLDTCHVFDAGYDIKSNLESVLEEFDKEIGISKLRAVHLNDSKNAIGSKKDRHEKIGKGTIGIAAFENIVNNEFLKNLPFILETPQEKLSGYADEISILKSLSK